MTLIFVNYWDVWGNETDGWDVNDVSRRRLAEGSIETEADVLECLKTNDLVHSDVTLADVIIELDESGAEITERANGKPFGRIEWEYQRKLIITELTKELWGTHYGTLIEGLLKDHGAVEITEDEDGCIIDIREVEG